MLKPFGYTSIDTAIGAVFFLFAGLVSSVFLSWLVDRTKRFNAILISCAALSLVTTSLMYVSLPSQRTWAMAMNAALVGLGMIPLMNIPYTYVVELTYPISEPMSNGVMQFFYVIQATIMTVVVTRLIEHYGDKGPQAAVTTFLIMEAISLVSLFFIKEDLRRLNYE
jgi:MFS family permease